MAVITSGHIYLSLTTTLVVSKFYCVVLKKPGWLGAQAQLHDMGAWQQVHDTWTYGSRTLWLSGGGPQCSINRSCTHDVWLRIESERDKMLEKVEGLLLFCSLEP